MGWWERAHRWVDARVFALDAVGTAVLLLVAVPTAAPFLGSPGGIAPGVWAFLVVLPLAWRRTRPVASAVAVYAAGLLQLLAGHPLILPADLAVLVALHSVTVHGPTWAHRTAIVGAVVGSGALAIGLVLVDVNAGLGTGLGVALFASIAALAVWALGLVRRARRETITALRDRAERLEIERDQHARLATSAERARIAREMHDIVAHSLSVVVAQADGGRYAAQTDPAAATRSLETIAETGRAALVDMRRLLGVLRTGDDGEAALVPQPAGDVDQLLEQVRASGLRVSLVRVGVDRPLPAGVGLVVYRLVQESLTNVLKHAGPDPGVTVLMRWSADSLRLEVADDGRGAAATSDGRGHGLVGMRERAAILGGSVTAGPRPGGGFTVRADLPLAP
ncbi:sensor histidine kinase [Cellulomonas fimi]|uniref:histidine kinase n=1 Tax=Cellulomonas fimi TaxID=1708 RepID=A0A7Y0LZL0_CELFI|nr:sensor histidine kinase [Cellulomonas fimi]NMR20844.1 sensor histidine kinase [Cellulomonas fimi]